MRIIIFYGTECDETTAWIPWIKKQLTDMKLECLIPNLPTPENQNFKN